ncbi:hypothetical protein B9Q03_14600, partial [Candidatus Marsarchaeota G2 archaeon OSP_D]
LTLASRAGNDLSKPAANIILEQTRPTAVTPVTPQAKRPTTMRIINNGFLVKIIEKKKLLHGIGRT